MLTLYAIVLAVGPPLAAFLGILGAEVLFAYHTIPKRPRPWCAGLVFWLAIGHWIMVALFAGLFLLLFPRVWMGAPPDALILVVAMWFGLVTTSHIVRKWIPTRWGAQAPPPAAFDPSWDNKQLRR